MKKVVLGSLSLVVFIAVGVFAYLYLNLNSLIKEGVETFAPQYTKTDVSLDSAGVSLFSGAGGLYGLTIGNPSGYKAPKSFHLDSIDLALDKDSLLSDTIIIQSIEVVAPQITYEAGGKAGSNLQQLVKNIQASTASSGGTGKEATGDEPEKKLIIDRLVIREGKLQVMTPLSDKPLEADLPTIEMKDIGRDKGGASSAEVFKMVMEKITGAATNVANISVDKLKGMATQKVEEAVSGLKDKVQLDGKAGEVGDKLKGLFR